MSFKDDVPNFKTLNSEDLYTNEVPDCIWGQLAGFVMRACDGDTGNLKEILDKFSAIAYIKPTTNWQLDWLKEDLEYALRQIRIVGKRQFEVFMDSLAAIYAGSHNGIGIDDFNEFIEEHNIGYQAYLDFMRELHWIPLEKISDVAQGIEELKEEVKTVSQQAEEHLQQARIQLERANNERARKDAVRDCASALEALITQLGGIADIRQASKKLRDSGLWGEDIIVKDGDAIFNRLHELYPDFRHGAPAEAKSSMSENEAYYWVDRITSYMRYMIRQLAMQRK